MSSKLEYLAKKGMLGLDALHHANTEPAKLQEMFPNAFPAPTGEDENTLQPRSPRNALIDAIGLPEGWKQTVADEKRWKADFAENAAMGMGSVEKVGVGAIEAASKKLTPELAQKLKALYDNPQEGVKIKGAVNNSLQVLLDKLGNVGAKNFGK